jgi:hypothetical protein
MRLRVGLDVSPLALTRAGAARYIESLLAALPADEVDVRRYELGGSSRALVPVRDVGWYLAATSRLSLGPRRSLSEMETCGHN